MRCVPLVCVVRVATEVCLLLCLRLYPRLDSSQPENIAESIAQEKIQTLHTLVVQFTRDHAARTGLCAAGTPKFGVLENGSCARFMCIGRWNFVEVRG
jgi:hypothetical protein